MNILGGYQTDEWASVWWIRLCVVSLRGERTTGAHQHTLQSQVPQGHPLAYRGITCHGRWVVQPCGGKAIPAAGQADNSVTTKVTGKPPSGPPTTRPLGQPAPYRRPQVALHPVVAGGSACGVNQSDLTAKLLPL